MAKGIAKEIRKRSRILEKLESKGMHFDPYRCNASIGKLITFCEPGQEPVVIERNDRKCSRK